MALTCRGVFETEAEAEDFALNGNERLWALVVFKEGPSVAGADYTIRHNFTTVPTTWVTVNKYRHSVPIDYKVCCTCRQFCCRVWRYGAFWCNPASQQHRPCSTVWESRCPDGGPASQQPVQELLGRDF